MLLSLFTNLGLLQQSVFMNVYRKILLDFLEVIHCLLGYMVPCLDTVCHLTYTHSPKSKALLLFCALLKIRSRLAAPAPSRNALDVNTSSLDLIILRPRFLSQF